MLLRGILLLFSIIKWEASTPEQIWIPIILRPLSVAVKNNTALAGYLNITLYKKKICSVETCKRHFIIIKEEDTVLSPRSLWFDSCC